MRVLLHTPLKPPDSPTPSGDREMARGFARLLSQLGHHVIMPAASRIASGVPPASAHLALERRARAQAARLIGRWHALPAGHPERFDLWFTYHCYYRKPDWLGPIVSRALGIPYVIADAGIVVPEADECAWSEAIGGLLAQPDRIQSLGRKGRARAVATYSWDAVGIRLVQYFDRVLGLGADGSASASTIESAG